MRSCHHTSKTVNKLAGILERGCADLQIQYIKLHPRDRQLLEAVWVQSIIESRLARSRTYRRYGSRRRSHRRDPLTCLVGELLDGFARLVWLLVGFVLTGVGLTSRRLEAKRRPKCVRYNQRLIDSYSRGRILTKPQRIKNPMRNSLKASRFRISNPSTGLLSPREYLRKYPY